MTHAFVVVNPASGGGATRARFPAIRDALRAAGVEFVAAQTRSPGDATELTRKAADAGWPLVIAVGGDGTINEVVNGLVDKGRPLTSLGIVSTGRGRDACRNLGIPRREAAAVKHLVAASERRTDLGVAEWADGRRRYFLNAAGAGFDATVAARARDCGGAGTFPYLAAVLGALRGHRPVPATLHVDDTAALARRVTAVVVANGARYGGGMKIAPAADPTDGALDFVVIGDLGRLALLRWLPTLYRGSHLACDQVISGRARTVAITAEAPLPFHVDGEPAGDTPVRISVAPGALRLRG